MSEHEVKMVILSTDNLEESIASYSDTLGMELKFRDGAHFAALNGGPVTLALATDVDHPIPRQVVVGIKTPRARENSQLVTNLAYTLPITRIAHYIKSIMRDNIGITADETYIQKTIDAWLAQYVTTVNNPDDLTLRFYPFKAVQVGVKARAGEIGWYDCSVAILPHIQFEGMNVELRLESRLGAK